MSRRRRVFGAVALALIAGCSSGSPSGSEPPAEPEVPAASAPADNSGPCLTATHYLATVKYADYLARTITASDLAAQMASVRTHLSNQLGLAAAPVKDDIQAVLDALGHQRVALLNTSRLPLDVDADVAAFEKLKADCA